MKKSGFTLVEIMVVVVILGILATVVVINVTDQPNIARRKVTTASISNIKTVIALFKLQQNHYPNSLEELANKPAGSADWPADGYIDADALLDGWGNKFVYKIEQNGYSVVSYAAEGKEGGDGENEDIKYTK
ncbi:MAG: type II secretion system major pseudopilin GspG [Planctomycetes bacterium]|nr:type II secretion system major pseudopilin GspG [Planctomycetota bacterium]